MSKASKQAAALLNLRKINKWNVGQNRPSVVKMELSETNFDIDLDLCDKLIPWLNPEYWSTALREAALRSGAPGPAVEQSNFNNTSHPLKEEFMCETTNKITNHFKFTRSNNIISIQDILPPPTALEIQQGCCQRPFGQSGENRYICTICGKHFSFMFSFRNHQKIHTGIGLHFCLFCPKTFPSRRKWKVWVFCLFENMH